MATVCCGQRVAYQVGLHESRFSKVTELLDRIEPRSICAPGHRERRGRLRVGGGLRADEPGASAATFNRPAQSFIDFDTVTATRLSI